MRGALWIRDVSQIYAVSYLVVIIRAGGQEKVEKVKLLNIVIWFEKCRFEAKHISGRLCIRYIVEK